MGVTLQFIPYAEIAKLSSLGRIKKLLASVKEDKIVLLEGRLTKEEEAELIKTTMEEISSKFRGIELHVLYPDERDNNPIQIFKRQLTTALLGNRQGLTIIGPASIVKEIRKDPNKIQLFTRDKKKRR